MLRKLLFSVLCVALMGLALAAPKRVSNFDQLYKGATAGKTIRAVVHYAQTVLTIDGKEEPAPAAVGGMTFNTWEYFPAGMVRNKLPYLVSSETHLIAHPSYGHVFNYVRLRIYSDGSVEITAQYLKPTTYEVVMNETFRGNISNGKDKNGVNLFIGD
jgi:hypothetical protein